jgi:hypothetical protein
MLPLKLENKKTTNTEINSCIRGFTILIYENLIRENASFVDNG